MNVAVRHSALSLRRLSPHRRGFSLLETMVAASISTAILLIAIGWIHQSFKLAKAVKEKQQHHQQLMRLGDQFRQDVRLCGHVSRDADGRLVLHSEEHGDVVYEVEGDVVFRVHIPTDAAITHRERYSPASGSDIRWDETELPQWITLAVHRSSAASERSDSTAADWPVDLRVRAAVGRWLIASPEEADR